MGVQIIGDRQIRERFSFHHRTPMATRVTNREKNWLILSFCAFKSLFCPTPPINGVFSVFSQIKALALGKMVRHNQLRKIKLKSLERPETLSIAIASFP
jgi:hypothetical protein